MLRGEVNIMPVEKNKISSGEKGTEISGKKIKNIKMGLGKNIKLL